MAGFTIELKGLDQTLKRLDVTNFKQQVQEQLDGFGFDTARDAALLAPVDEGHLKGSINAKPGNMSVTITAGVDYAAYIEFGTRKYAAEYVATLPLTWQEFAATFRGSGGGTFEELVMAITRWVQIKGIGATFNVISHRRDRIGKQSAKTTDENTAYEIARYIIINGIHAHPFLYPAFEKNRLLLIERLKTLL